ncbi:MAG: PepSY-associated TM helix domain-containing protein [Nostoc sp.]|uniref:PepSY-associated TM helix domain-containing protein n=1 Tax=Nostoc sp. TaxID=1180 RepID=UPI002FF6BE91
MSKSKKFRDVIFNLHRYLGLVVGLIAIIAGLTGSLLVFMRDIDNFAFAHKYGAVIPQGVHGVSLQKNRLPLSVLVDRVKAAHVNEPDFQIGGIFPYGLYFDSTPKPDVPAIIGDFLVDPYTGKLLAQNPSWFGSEFFGKVYEIHTALLIGDAGAYILGIAAALMVILSVTGIVLWPGWRKLSSGFKIKLDARAKRLNFDIHKVVGIILGVVLLLPVGTGAWWDFPLFGSTLEIIFMPVDAVASIFTPQTPQTVDSLATASTPTPSQKPFPLDVIVQKAQAALPNFSIFSIGVPSKSQAGTYDFRMISPRTQSWDSEVHIDQYTGEILQVVDGTKITSLLGRLSNYSTPLHYGVFGGLSTKILYVFVGISPAILLVTGLNMFRLRHKRVSRKNPVDLSNESQS